MSPVTGQPVAVSLAAAVRACHEKGGRMRIEFLTGYSDRPVWSDWTSEPRLESLPSDDGQRVEVELWGWQRGIGYPAENVVGVEYQP